jgi:RNA polymerase sigma-70 factor (ECF subfamily)
MAPPSEPELISRARAGDKGAFESLIAPLLGPAARLAYFMLNDRAETEDAVQEAALKTWRGLRTFRAGSDFKPWFLGIVANQCRTVRRARWWSVVRLEHAPAAGRPDPDVLAVRGADLRRALLALPSDQRAAILLHFYSDLPLEDVARVLGISVPGVKSRINRALKRLRPAMQSGEVPA